MRVVFIRRFDRYWLHSLANCLQTQNRFQKYLPKNYRATKDPTLLYFEFLNLLLGLMPVLQMPSQVFDVASNLADIDSRLEIVSFKSFILF
jgi:hypothetical protein